MMFHVKHIFAVLAVVLILSLSVFSAFAAPTPFPSPTTTGGALSLNNTMRLAEAVSAQFAFISSTAFTEQSVAPLAILANEIASDDQWEYTIILAPTSASVGVIPEDWGVRGATIPIGSNYCYRVKYSFSPFGGMGTWVYVNTTNGLVLGANEWIVYLYKGNGAGLHNTTPAFPWGNFSVIPAVDNWLNALEAFDGKITTDKVDEAYNDGIAEGYTKGYLEGEANGIHKSDVYWNSEIPHIQSVAQNEGERIGYERAVEELGKGDNASYTLDIPSIFSAIPSSAKAIINNTFGFEIFGINIAGLLSVILIISIVGFIVAKLTSR